MSMRIVVMLMFGGLSAGAARHARLVPLAQPVAQETELPDARTRSLVREVCAACHGLDGVSVSEGIPHLAGQRTLYLERQLNAFKSGGRKHDFMSVIAARLEPSDMTPLARYFSEKGPLPSAEAKSPRLPQFARTNATLPVDFPKGFTRYNTSEDRGLKSIMFAWANDAAWNSARAKETDLPVGSIVVSENWRARVDDKGAVLLDAQGRMIPERLQSYGVIAKGQGWGDGIHELLRNGDWNYAVYNAERKRDIETNLAICFVCHQTRASEQYLFTRSKLAAAARGQ
ncbi:MAG: cytochrome P460 family protein [Vicinamibacteria bacterium]|nr:cytochrome P460 family protein [Vicinamibacteria bacterium]